MSIHRGARNTAQGYPQPQLRLWPTRYLRDALRLLGLVVALTHASDAFAVERTCGPDPVANTVNVLCAAPSGPCTATSVTLSANIEIRSGGCALDIGGRNFTIQKTVQMTGLGLLSVKNASSITITGTGKLKARGDFVQPAGFIVRGGQITLESSGPMTINGQLDVSGDPGGSIGLVAAGSTTLAATALLQASGITSFTQDSQRFADGGEIDIASTGGAVTVAADLILTGLQGGAGGFAFLEAARTLRIDGAIDASGGASDGGLIGALAGDDIIITKELSVESRGGGGYGGAILLEAGFDELTDLASGGSLTIENAALQMSGSSFEGFAGDGGELDAVAKGALRVIGQYARIRANAGASFGGSGGFVSLVTEDADPFTVGPLDGDITLEGNILAQSGSGGGAGGIVSLAAGRNMTVAASIDVSGASTGGDVDARAGGALLAAGPVIAEARGATGAPGYVDFGAGFARDADLTVERDFLAAGGSGSAGGQIITLRGCGLTVRSGTKIDGHAGMTEGMAGGSDIILMARRPMSLQANTQFLAYPAGSVTTIHPSGQTPIIASGVLFSPPRSDLVDSNAAYPACPP